MVFFCGFCYGGLHAWQSCSLWCSSSGIWEICSSRQRQSTTRQYLLNSLQASSLTMAVHMQTKTCLKMTGKCGNFVFIGRLLRFPMQHRLIKNQYGSESKPHATNPKGKRICIKALGELWRWKTLDWFVYRLSFFLTTAISEQIGNDYYGYFIFIYCY